MNTEFSQRLRKLRERRGLKRKVLSELCGLHPRAIQEYEQGIREPKLSSLVKIAEFLECSMEDLTGK